MRKAVEATVMAFPMKIRVKIALAVALAVAGGLLLQHRARTSQRELAELLPAITNITVYDLGGRTAGSNVLASASSAPFPLDAFRRAAASATHKRGVVAWKGSSLAMIRLNDGTERQARFSYYGGFFTIEGLGGYFIAPGGGASEFQRLHEQLIQEQFVPRRQERDKKP